MEFYNFCYLETETKVMNTHLGKVTKLREVKGNGN